MDPPKFFKPSAEVQAHDEKDEKVLKRTSSLVFNKRKSNSGTKAQPEPSGAASDDERRGKRISGLIPARKPSVVKSRAEMSGGVTATEIEEYNSVSKIITEHTWYHGLMPRKECEQMLKHEGDFLVRWTKMAGLPAFCISVFSRGTCKHIPLKKEGSMWSVADKSSPTPNELIDRLVREGKPIGETNVVLKTPIHRDDFYLLHDNIIVEKQLGTGAFGIVCAGRLKLQDKTEIRVAIKQGKEALSKKQINEIVKEAKVMRRINHRNCIRIYGAAVQMDPMMIVLELAPGGSLKSYLKANPKCPTSELLGFTQDAARGMCYLSVSQVIHRDLAARNCLLGENNVLKIADFGLSVIDKNELKLDKLKKVPVKWLAPETLERGVFTTKSDVWSFAVLTWEIFTHCQTEPFPNESNVRAKEKILSGQKPMEPPPGSPPTVVTVMNVCFVKVPELRPDFKAILAVLCPGEQPPVAAAAT